MRILVTGGAGYIGSTAAQLLIEQGYDITIFDDCSTGHADSVPEGVKFVRGSLLDSSAIALALAGCDAVMHFAGKSLVGESVTKPELYWSVNVGGTRNLLDQMRAQGISKLVFSSSAATYGEPKRVPILEGAPTRPTNAYGATKLAIDAMITDESRAGHDLAAISLRYFNVAGALHCDRGWLAERHSPETHLIPNVLRSTSDLPVKVFGTDWPTQDGTCIRDYIHVADLADAHVRALDWLGTRDGSHAFNLGTGTGASVRQVIEAVERVARRPVPHGIGPRRAGDPAQLISDPAKAMRVLSWTPVMSDLDTIVATAWAWHIRNDG